MLSHIEHVTTLALMRYKKNEFRIRNIQKYRLQYLWDVRCAFARHVDRETALTLARYTLKQIELAKD